MVVIDPKEARRLLDADAVAELLSLVTPEEMGLAWCRYAFVTTNVNRSGQAVASVETTVQAPWPGATAEIYVLRNPNYQTRQFVGGKLVSGPQGQNQIVFQEQTSLTNLTSRPSPPADDKWSSTVSLDPSEWDGGCQNAPYGIMVEIGHPAHSAESGSPFFTCNPGSSGGSR